MKDWYEVANSPLDAYNLIVELRENNALLMDQLADSETTICMLLEDINDYDDDNGEGY